MSIMTCLAGGVIMGALLFHLIPEFLPHSDVHCPHDDHDNDLGNFPLSGPGPHDHFSHSTHEHHNEGSHDSFSYYKWGSLAAGLSFFFLLGIDRFFLSHYHCPKELPCSTVHERQLPGGSIEPDPLPKPESALYPQHPIHCSGLSLSHGDHHDSHYINPLAICDSMPACVHSHSGSKSDPVDLEKAEVFCRPKSNVDANYLEDDHSSCHSGDVMGGCHMDGINEYTTKVQSLIFVAVLSFHSFLEGLAMSSIASNKDLISFCLSLFLHKVLEAFALGVNVFKAGFAAVHFASLIFLYSILTPIGIVLSMSIHPYPIVVQILNGLAAGSFLYVACIEMIVPEFHKPDPLTKYKFISLLVGYAMMALVATMSPEHTH